MTDPDLSKSASRYWRSLNQLADEPSFRNWMEREFPKAASELPESVSRRRWLQLMGASLAFGGLAGCRWQAEEFAPFTVRPQNRIPGQKQFFSTVWELGGIGRPLTLTSIDGRPVKVEGNLLHPFTRGGTDVFDQASILSLYDPDRSDGIVERAGSGTVRRSWEEFDAALLAGLTGPGEKQGQGLAILCGASSSLSRQHLRRLIADRFPKAVWCQHEPALSLSEVEGTQVAFGSSLRALPDFSRARIVACFDADPMSAHPASMKFVRDWADKRDPDGEWMNRVYAFESNVSLTGSSADHRVAVPSRNIPELIVELERLVESGLAEAPTPPVEHVVETNESEGHGEQHGTSSALRALADDLLRHRGASILMAGSHQPAEVHARLHRLNNLLGNHGSTIVFADDDRLPAGDSATIGELISAMESGTVSMLLILDVNAGWGESFSARFVNALPKVPFSVYAGLYRDETAQHCLWHVPLAHFLESWSDSRTWDGTITLGQPLIEPIFGGRTSLELLSLLSDGVMLPAERIVRRALVSYEQDSAAGSKTWSVQTNSLWQRAVHDGFVSDSQSASKPVALADELDSRIPTGRLSAAERSLRNPDGPEGEGPEIVFTLDSSTFDGRFANNGWLQETPDPITKLTWDNAAIIGPAMAESAGMRHGEIVRLSVQDASVEIPLFVLPGVANGSIQLARGYGRPVAGHVGGLISESIDPVGTDVSPLLPERGSVVASAVRIESTGRMYQLATTQDHFSIDAVGFEAIGARLGELIRTGTLSEYQEHPDFVQHRGPHHPPLESLWPEREYTDYAWGMAIDLNRCIGCNACTVACQSENNVPIVGREQVLAGREMSWLRIDRYFAGDPNEPEMAHQPVACHHCENAPCEQVCPVAATVHSDEGLNDMVYNRCVGTRYCANNCPYKVRRFNFFDYNASLSEPGNELTRMILNPEVTVRSRGVMEKCTYCVQRIQSTKIEAKNERRAIRDGEILPACQQACPTQAIVFGNLNDPDSVVSRAHQDQRSYGMLAELNTKPRTKYLARIRNPHPWLQNSSTTTPAAENLHG